MDTRQNKPRQAGRKKITPTTLSIFLAFTSTNDSFIVASLFTIIASTRNAS